MTAVCNQSFVNEIENECPCVFEARKSNLEPCLHVYSSDIKNGAYAQLVCIYLQMCYSKVRAGLSISLRGVAILRSKRFCTVGKGEISRILVFYQKS